MTKDSTRRLAEIGVVAALYVALTWALAPLSYGPLQFRVSEILKSLVIWEPHLIPAFVIGVFIGNLTSPYVGPWELVFMPFANLIGAGLCFFLGRRSPWLGAGMYALTIASSVSLMLSVVARVPFTVLFPGIFASEFILIVGGVPIMKTLLRAVGAARHRGAARLEKAGSIR